MVRSGGLYGMKEWKKKNRNQENGVEYLGATMGSHSLMPYYTNQYVLEHAH